MLYCEDDFIYETQWKSDEQNFSEFDHKLISQWNNAVEKGYFRYSLNITDSRLLPGKYSFLAQVNSDRHQKRRAPSEITRLSQPFDATKFNFTRVRDEEHLFSVGSPEHLLIINVSPLERGHCLLVPSLHRCLPQVITLPSLQLLLEVLLLSGSPALRAGFNGLCAYASVNHLHYHFYYLQQRMLLEHIVVECLSGPCYQLVDYPAPGFVFQLPESRSVADLARAVHHLTSYLQEANIPHNLYVTRGSKFNSPDAVYNTVRVYVWVRKPSGAIKELEAFNPALCELFGHFIVKTDAAFHELTEEGVSAVLADICQETFTRIRENVRQLFEDFSA